MHVLEQHCHCSRCCQLCTCALHLQELCLKCRCLDRLRCSDRCGAECCTKALIEGSLAAHRLVSATKEVVYYADIYNASMINASSWQYVMNNAGNSLYEGYTWTMDAYTSFVWGQLNSLKLVVIILLALEVRWGLGFSGMWTSLLPLLMLMPLAHVITGNMLSSIQFWHNRTNALHVLCIPYAVAHHPCLQMHTKT